MKNSSSQSYAAAGVDITAGYRAVELMKQHVARTLTPGVVSDIGGFGGLFAPDLAGLHEPILVSGTDGVGTKLRLAFQMDRHDTVGIDCVAMNVMVVGGGGREHAIVRKLLESPQIGTVYVLPGNGGIASEAICVPIGAKDLDGIAAFAEAQAIDFAVIAPDDPLVLGCADRLGALGIPCFGPTARAAAIEGSKIFSKNLMFRSAVQYFR